MRLWLRGSYRPGALRAPQWLGILAGALTLLPTVPAWSLPAFARAMGVPCATCHTLAFGPALTAFGRNFKLHGYALATNKDAIPLSADLIASYTHTAADQPAVKDFSTNNNYALDSIDGYFAGRITDHFGALAQASYDGIAHHTAWGIFDARYARDLTLGGVSTLIGVSLNNFPTVQDPWNSLYAWQFPYPGARLAPGPSAFLQLNGAYATQTLGATVYAMVNDFVYLEAGGYRKLSDRLQSAFGVPRPELEHGIDGIAPYWRAALQKTIGSQYVSAGLIGFLPSAQSPSEQAFGTDDYNDVGVDATYQFANGGHHSFNAYTSYIHENQHLYAATAIGASSAVDNHLSIFTLTGQYAYRQTYALALGYFDISGNPNARAYPVGPWFGSANNSPDSRYFILQAEMIPFGKIASFGHPFLNMRYGVQYTAYTLFNGGTTNYDGSGHSAGDNNTVFVFLWTTI